MRQAIVSVCYLKAFTRINVRKFIFSRNVFESFPFLEENQTCTLYKIVSIFPRLIMPINSTMLSVAGPIDKVTSNESCINWYQFAISMIHCFHR